MQHVGVKNKEIENIFLLPQQTACIKANEMETQIKNSYEWQYHFNDFTYKQIDINRFLIDPKKCHDALYRF